MRPSETDPSNALRKPIGGFFELESPLNRPAATAPFESRHQLRFWNARSALLHLLRAQGASRLWLPAYICGEPAAAAVQAGCEVLFYPVGGDLVPDARTLAAGLRARDAVLGVDYFGAPAAELPDLARRFDDVMWIQDRAQALWPDPAPWGTHLLYSPRKVAGAPDGGVLVSPGGAIRPPVWAVDEKPDRLEPARMRAEDPLGRRNDVWFPAYQAAEASMSCAPLPMSELSATVVDRLDTSGVASRRRRNARVLMSRLAGVALFEEARLLGGAPLGVPVLVDDAGAASARMAQERIFCARHWARLPSPPADFAAEHALSRRLLTLPCDHRYDGSDMVRVAETFLATQ